jgi:putative ABC transport system substrate-binding protein
MGDMGNSDMQAKNMVAKGEALLVGIATPAAMSTYAAARDSGVPVVFVAVSDAVAAGIVQSNEQPGGIATGVSDVLNFPAQLELIRAFLPDAKTIGVIYTVSEPNSIAQLAALTELAPGYGFTIESIGVTSPADVAGAAASLAAKGVDCFNNLTDNNVVDNMSQELRAAGDANIPVFGSEVEQVINGCLAAQGIDYTELGRKAGLMAADILSGRSSPDSTPVLLVNDVTPVYNSAVLAKLGLILPESFADAQDASAKD